MVCESYLNKVLKNPYRYDSGPQGYLDENQFSVP